MKEIHIIEVLNRLLDNIRYSKVKYEHEVKIRDKIKAYNIS